MEMMPMSIRRLLQPPLLCVLILSLLVSPVSALGYVWCLSADGHASVETAVAGDCGGSAPTRFAHDLCADPPAGGDGDCGPCLDISSAPSWGSSRSRDSGSPASIPVASAAFAAAALPPLSARALSIGHVAEPTLRTAEAIRSHRTIVLLI